jgi:serine/threonine-protein kinase
MPRLRFLRPPTEGWLVGLVVLAAAVATFTCPLWRAVDRAWNDRVAVLAAAPPGDAVVLVAIDDASVAHLGPWPWPRSRTAALLRRIAEAGASAVAIAEPLSGRDSGPALAELQQIATIVATDPDLIAHPRLPAQLSLSHDELDGDTQLAQGLAGLRFGALAAASVSAEAGAGPGATAGTALPAVLTQAARAVGHVQFEVDADGLIRRLPRVAMTTEGERPSLAQLIAETQGAGAGGTGAAIQPMPPARHGAAPPTLSAWQLLDEAGHARLKPVLRGKAVVLGRTDAEARHLQLVGHPRADVSRAEAVAWAAAALVDGQVQHRPRLAQAAPAVALLVVAGALLGVWPRLQTRALLLSAAALAALLLLAAQLSIGLLRTPVNTAGAALTLAVGTLVVLLLRQRRERPASPAPSPDAAPPAGDTAWPLSVADGAGSAGGASRLGSPSTFVAATVPAALAVPAGPEGAAPAPPRLPRLGRYQLDRELGRGTMGRVYLAHEIGRSNEVAIKTLALAREFEGFALREARARFQTEAQAARRLRHPDIVQVIDAGEDRGLAYLVMERLHGTELTPHVHARALLPVSTVVAIGARVADALAHAHAQGVIHRDIKPANVMIDGPRDQVKVMDFGIARLHDASRTRTGLVLGSPSYMSPEQLAGREVDGRSDLYALGVLLFQMLTAQLPLVGATMAGLIHAIANVKAPDVRELRAGVPEALADVISILLEKRAELRYRTGHELAADLRLIGQQLQRRSVPTAGRPEVSAVAPRTGPGTPGREAVHEVAPDPSASPGTATMRAQSAPDHGP